MQRCPFFLLQNTIILLFAGALVLMPVKAFSQTPAPTTLSTLYDVHFLGIRVGKAALNGSFTNEGYALTASAKVSGIASVLANGHGTAEAKGQLSPFSPQSYTLNVLADEEEDKVSMVFEKKVLKTVSAHPPSPPHPDRIAVSKEHHQNVIDPLSAFVFSIEGEATGATLCNRVLPIFDGRQRYNFNLKFSKSIPQKNIKGLSTPIFECTLRYTPLAGHRKTRKINRFMAENKDIHIWLTPISKTLAVPVKIHIGLPTGHVSFWARKFNVTNP